MTKILYLVRHAKSSWDDSDVPDYKRPLSRRGLKDSKKMGEAFASSYEKPAFFITSPARRAFDTAVRMAEAIGYDPLKVSFDEDIYEAGMDELYSVVRKLNDKFDSVMMFGHNPGMTSFANSLASLDIDNIPTCGIVCLKFNLASWKSITPGSGEFIFFDYPKKS